MSGSVQWDNGVAVEGATVRVSCDRWGEVEAVTDDEGHFDGGGVAQVSDECVGRVELEGAPAQKFDPIHYCVEGDSDYCQAMKAKLTMRLPVTP